MTVPLRDQPALRVAVAVLVGAGQVVHQLPAHTTC
jgi:hypothetical protein